MRILKKINDLDIIKVSLEKSDFGPFYVLPKIDTDFANQEDLENIETIEE